MNKEKNMPVLFVGHGSPMNAIENSPAREGCSDRRALRPSACGPWRSFRNGLRGCL